MPLPRARMVAALVACLLVAPAAEARFGKRSKPSESEQKTHDATPVGKDDEGGGDDAGDSSESEEDSDDECCDVPRGLGEALLGGMVQLMLQGAVEVIRSTGNHLEGLEVAGSRHAAPLSVRMGVQALLLRAEAGGSDLFLGVDGQRLGMDAHLIRLSLPAEDGSGGVDHLSLASVHLGWAIYAVERARLRAEVGVSSAHAPDITFLGPSLGMSFEACVVGPLDVEARAQVTPFPYRQVDGAVGLALHLGGLVLRGGARGLFLDDAGHLDDVAHQDSVLGPYLGVGFTF